MLSKVTVPLPATLTKVIAVLEFKMLMLAVLMPTLLKVRLPLVVTLKIFALEFTVRLSIALALSKTIFLMRRSRASVLTEALTV